VVGIDIDYEHTPGGYARFLVWRAGKEKGVTKAILSDPNTVNCPSVQLYDSNE
jgi:hypothetical protein